MKGITRRILSFVLCGILLFTCAYPVAAAEEAIENDLPIVHVLGRLKAIYNADGKQIYPFKQDLTDIVMADSDSLVSSVATSLLTGNWHFLGDTISKNLKPSFNELVLDGNGEIYNGTYTLPYTEPRPIESNYQMNDYLFNYDWRLDPMDNADLLDGVINTALADHGCEKVDIICCSMGGSITMAYMAEYGYSKLDTVISNTSVMFGSDVITDLFRGKVEFDADTVDRYVSAMVPALAGIIKFANVTGGLDVLCKLLNDFAQKHEKQIFDESLIPTFATLPGFWSMMDGNAYPEAREFIFGDKEDEYKGLLTRLDAFYNSVSSRRQEITDGAIANGVKLAIIANYNTPLVPAYESAKYQGDGMIETGAMSGGAITSVVGYELSEEELGIGELTLQDIVKELEKPARDPREDMPKPILRSDVLEMKDLTPGMVLKGTVRNVIDFGAFVDIGVHQDGLVHVSQMVRRVKHPSELVRVGDVVTVWVLQVDQARKRISLTMRKPAEK